MSRGFFTEEMFLFMEQHQDMTLVEFIVIFNERFNCNKRTSNISQAIREHKKDIKFARSYKKFYTEEMIQFLRDNVEGKSNIELAKMFNDKFGTDKTSRHINDLKKHYGIVNHSGFVHKGNSGCFQKGHKPWNTYQVGSITYDRDDEHLYIKVTENDKLRSVYNRKQLARVIYQLWNGDEVGPGETIIFLDNNRFNFAKENMMKVKRSLNNSVSTKMFHDGIDLELKPTMVLTELINREIKKKEEDK